MIEEGTKRETSVKSELAELKKKNIQKSTLKASHHAIWENIKRIILDEMPHLVLTQEEVDLIIMAHNKVDRITKEMDEKPHKFQ